MLNFHGYIKFLNCRKYQKEQGFQNKLEMYKILYQAYADEIKNLWQRSIFLGAFMTLAWGGYGALQLKFIDKVLDKSFALGAYHYYSILLCFVIIILSLLWIAMAKGSKFVQEAHEKHIKRYIKFYQCSVYCDLKKYEKKLNEQLSNNLLFCNSLRGYRYSPSKINIILGWFSALMAITLGIVHIVLAFSCWAVLGIFVIILMCCIVKSLKQCLKGGEQDKPETITHILTNLKECVINLWECVKNKTKSQRKEEK